MLIVNVHVAGVYAQFSENRFHDAILLGAEEIPNRGLNGDEQLVRTLGSDDLHERIMSFLPTCAD